MSCPTFTYIPALTADKIFNFNEYEFFSEESQSNTTSNGWVNKLNETTSSKPAGTYLIDMHCEVANSDKQKRIGVRLQVDGSTVGDQRSGVSVDNQYESRRVLYELSHTGGTIDLDVDFGQTDDGGTGRIRDVRVYIMRVA